MRRIVLFSALLVMSLYLSFGAEASDELTGNLLFVRALDEEYVFCRMSLSDRNVT